MSQILRITDEDDLCKPTRPIFCLVFRCCMSYFFNPTKGVLLVGTGIFTPRL